MGSVKLSKVYPNDASFLDFDEKYKRECNEQGITSEQEKLIDHLRRGAVRNEAER